MDNIIEVSGLKKSYGRIQAVKGIDFSVKQGTLFAFLGPNGAGKSTTIDILCTLLKQDGGRVLIDGNLLGQDDDKIRSSIGVVFQDSILDKLLTVRENLLTRGRFYEKNSEKLKDAVKGAMEAAGVLEFADRPYGKLSGGQRRRADIARALVHMPKILFLDEPTTGLDPQTRKNVWETVQKMQKNSGLTVFLTTHYMEEAASADYVTIIDDGLIAGRGTPTELKSAYCTDYLNIKPKDAALLKNSLRDKNILYTASNDIISISLSKTTEAIPYIREWEDNIESFEVLNGTMDDVFINITGKEIREV